MTHFSKKHRFHKSHVGVIIIIIIPLSFLLSEPSSLLLSIKTSYISDMAHFSQPASFTTFKWDSHAWTAFLLALRVRNKKTLMRCSLLDANTTHSTNLFPLNCWIVGVLRFNIFTVPLCHTLTSYMQSFVSGKTNIISHLSCRCQCQVSSEYIHNEDKCLFFW